VSKAIFLKFKEYVKTSVIGTQHESESHIDNIFQVFNQNISTFSPANILDIGCGDGKRTIRIAGYYNINMRDVYGVDNDDNLITACKEMFTASRIDLEIDDIPHKEDTFDLVICNQVIEHLKNYKRTIYEAIRVVKKGGYIVIGIPNLAHLINRVYLLLGMQPMCIDLNGPHVRSFTHKSITKFLHSLESIKLIDCKGSLMYPLPFFLGRALARHFVGLSGYVCYLLQKI
jgi:2-polyprenyl-3-methyl-5-hydroxy-6-metoxy-1,4-benzoquinol methylase